MALEESALGEGVVTEGEGKFGVARLVESEVTGEAPSCSIWRRSCVISDSYLRGHKQTNELERLGYHIGVE